MASNSADTQQTQHNFDNNIDKEINGKSSNNIEDEAMIREWL